MEKVGEIGSGGSGSRIMNDVDFFSGDDTTSRCGSPSVNSGDYSVNLESGCLLLSCLACSTDT